MRVTHTRTGISAIARGRNFDHGLRLATRVVAAKVRAIEDSQAREDPRTVVRRYMFQCLEESVRDVRSGYVASAVRAVLDGDLDALLDAARRAVSVSHERSR